MRSNCTEHSTLYLNTIQAHFTSTLYSLYLMFVRFLCTINHLYLVKQPKYREIKVCKSLMDIFYGLYRHSTRKTSTWIIFTMILFIILRFPRSIPKNLKTKLKNIFCPKKLTLRNSKF